MSLIITLVITGVVVVILSEGKVLPTVIACIIASVIYGWVTEEPVEIPPETQTVPHHEIHVPAKTPVELCKERRGIWVFGECV